MPLSSFTPQGHHAGRFSIARLFLRRVTSSNSCLFSNSFFIVLCINRVSLYSSITITFYHLLELGYWRTLLNHCYSIFDLFYIDILPSRHPLKFNYLFHYTNVLFPRFIPCVMLFDILYHFLGDYLELTYSVFACSVLRRSHASHSDRWQY